MMVAGTGDAGGMVTIDELTPSTLYSIQVAAVNRDGDVGVLSAPLSVQTDFLASKYCVVPAAGHLFTLLTIDSFFMA